MRKPFEADDPMELVGAMRPAAAGVEKEMAYVFAEEFARLGYDERGLLRMFRNPFYAGAHCVYRALGEEAVSRIISECVQVWGRRPSSGGDDSLPEGV